MTRFQPVRKFTGAHMAVVIACFFCAVISVNLVMAILASRTWSGLIVPNSYVASQEFESRVEALKAQHDSGIKSSFEIAGGRLAVRIAADGKPARSVRSLSLNFRRPVHEAEDHTVMLSNSAPGLFTADHRLADGIWVVEMAARLDNGGTWSDSFRMHVRNGTSAR